MDFLKRLASGGGGKAEPPPVPTVGTESEKDRLVKRMDEIHMALAKETLRLADSDAVPTKFHSEYLQGAAQFGHLNRWNNQEFWEQVSMDEKEKKRFLALLSEFRELESQMKKYTAFSAPEAMVDYENKEKVYNNDLEGVDVLLSTLSVDYGLSPHADSLVESDLNDSLESIKFAQKTIQDNLLAISLIFDTFSQDTTETDGLIIDQRRAHLSTDQKRAYREAVGLIRNIVDTFSLAQLDKLNDLIDSKFTMTSDDARKKQRAIALDVQLAIPVLKNLVARGSEAIAVYEKPFSMID